MRVYVMRDRGQEWLVRADHLRGDRRFATQDAALEFARGEAASLARVRNRPAVIMLETEGRFREHARFNSGGLGLLGTQK